MTVCVSAAANPDPHQFQYLEPHKSSVMDLHHLDADPDSIYHPVADPDVDPDSNFYLMRIRILASKKKAQLLTKCSNRLIFNTFWLVICKLMRIRIRFRMDLITLMLIRIRLFV
jgi:hypothetical protein